MIKRPLLGAIAVLIKDDDVLLAQRRNPPDAGLWGFPGGHVEWGETAMEAAARELFEETGVRAEPIHYLTNIDLILPEREGGPVKTHYLLTAVLCRYITGTPLAADDVMDAAWVPVSEVTHGQRQMSARVEAVLHIAQSHRAGPDPAPPAPVRAPLPPRG